MSAEIYLARLEANCLLAQPEQTPPPEISNFYWINDANEKYKAFIVTPNRYVYYNLEEYVGDIEIGQICGWQWVSKCVLLSLTNTYPEDQPFINHMEHLIASLNTWRQTNNQSDGEDINKDLNRSYRITKYFVKDIKKVRLQLRGRHAVFRGEITVHPYNDAANVIHAMNIGFELAAERFANDQNHGVYAYGQGHGQ